MNCYNYFLILVEGDDFVLPDPLEAVVPSGTVTDGTQACLNIAIVDDGVFESDHGFGIILLSASLPSVSVSPTLSTITIQDNDGNLAVITFLTLALLCFNCCPYI